MTPITNVDAAVYIGSLLVLLSVITWVVLWTGRSRAVHLWALGGLASGAFLVFAAGPLAWASLPASTAYPVFAVVGCLSVGLRLEALRDLLGRRPAGRRLAFTVAGVALFGLSLAVAPAARTYGHDLLLVGMFAGLGWCGWLCHRLWRSQAIVNARVLTYTMGLPALVGLAGATLSLAAKESVLISESQQLEFSSLAINAVIACCNATLFIGMVFERQRRDTVHALHALAAAKAEQSRLEERSRIVDDLHDGFGSQLASARLKVEQGVLTQTAVANLLQECVSDLYLLVDTMNTSDGNVGDALRFFRHRTQDRLAGLPLVLHWRLDIEAVPPLPHSAIIQLLRIVQEALTNALRHASASNLWIEAERDRGGRLRVSVADDGIGFDGRALTAGQGLRSMRARAEGLGGELHISPRDPGILVELLVPVPPR